MNDANPAVPIRIDLPVFSGPLDLLLHLVQKEQVNIYDIPVAHITEQYLAYLSAMRELDVNVASDFLVMAATLVQIKARLLLPRPAAMDAGDDEEEDPRAALVRQLVEYRRFKESAGLLAELAARQNRVFGRVPPADDSSAPHVLFTDGDLEALTAAFQSLLETVEEDESPRPFQVDRVNVEDKVLLLTELLRSRKYLVFAEVFQGGTTRDEIVATFLALLEMARLGLLVVRQNAPLGRIELFPGPTLLIATDDEVLSN